MTPERATAHWYEVAAQEDRAAELGIKHPRTARAVADSCRRAARAMEYQIETGIAVCSCHMKPLAEGCRS